MLPASVRHLESFFAARIDPVDYGSVLRYLDARTSEIKQIVLVSPPLKLEQVAAAMSGLTGDRACQELIGHWFATEAILTLGHGHGRAQFDRDAFTAADRFRCLYRPPQYLIQPLEATAA